MMSEATGDARRTRMKLRQMADEMVAQVELNAEPAYAAELERAMVHRINELFKTLLATIAAPATQANDNSLDHTWPSTPS